MNMAVMGIIFFIVCFIGIGIITATFNKHKKSPRSSTIGRDFGDNSLLDRVQNTSYNIH